MDAIVINEYSILPEYMDFELPGTNFEQAPSGGLGWASGAALGAKLAMRDRDVILATGNGNYMLLSCGGTSCDSVKFVSIF
jgi:acetolactate synthase-1/2/3 large subunit